MEVLMKARVKNVADFVFEKAKPIVEELRLILWDVKFEKEGANYYLRVFIDKEDGDIDISDCERVNAPVNEMLDRLDPIEQSYVFEVSSTGLGRTLRRDSHFERFTGEEVKIGLYKADESGDKEITGKLLSHTKDETVIECGGLERRVKTSECRFVKLNDDADLFK